MEYKSNTLVLGIGNIFLGDEAVGVRLIEALEERFDIPSNLDIMDGGTCGMEMLDDMAMRKHIIVLDAVRSKKHVPGDIVLLKDQEVPVMFTTKISPHQLGLSDVLSALVMTDEFPQELTLIGIVPESLEFNQPLSQTVKNVFDKALDKLLEMLEAEGVILKEKVVPA